MARDHLRTPEAAGAYYFWAPITATANVNRYNTSTYFCYLGLEIAVSRRRVIHTYCTQRIRAEDKDKRRVLILSRAIYQLWLVLFFAVLYTHFCHRTRIIPCLPRPIPLLTLTLFH